MKNKCSKYEALFTFAGDDEFKSHLETCKDCRAEHERMNKVSELLKEVKPAFARQKSQLKLKAACFLLAALFTGAFFNANYLSGQTISAEDLGFPVDEYGLIMVDG